MPTQYYHKMELLKEQHGLHRMALLPSLLIFLLFFSGSAIASTISFSSNTSDRLALLSFKSLISDDPLGALVSWNDTSHHCRWHGITCGGSRQPQRVVALELNNLNLSGAISPHLSNLTFLRRLHLSTNLLHGHIPHEFSRLSRLQSLNLSFNSLDGEIPASLSNCSDLVSINLTYNTLQGPIPAQFGVLPKLQKLVLSENTLSGTLPSSLGNATSLEVILFWNDGLLGSIPESIGRLTRLRTFQVGENRLSGEIPASLFNLSRIQFFTAGSNQLVGDLPPNMFRTLPKLQMLLLNDNQLHGQIPVSLPNATELVEVDILGNNFGGTVPSNLGNLQKLYWVNLNMNQLEASSAEDWKFITSLTNCSYLGTLGLAHNQFGGELPHSLSNLSTRLDVLSLGQNQISGSIPEGIGNLVNLTVFSVEVNRLTGTLPTSIGKLRNLRVLNLSINNYTGPIPYSIGNLTQLISLYFKESGLSGSIPVSFGSCKNLLELDLSQNKLSGAVPRELLSLSSLSTYVYLSDNELSGSLPAEVSNLKNLGRFDISNNRISGEIPSTIGDCQSLEYLFMQGNSFHGSIPQAMSKLVGLRSLDLSRNNLSGYIPQQLASLRLLYLNLSYNNLQGEVPRHGVFENTSAVSLTGNAGLCGGDAGMNLPACYTESTGKKHMSLALKIIIPIIGMILLLVLLTLLLISLPWLKKPRRASTLHSFDDQFMKVSYNELLRATDGFLPSNLIGVGRFGSVYKGKLDSDEKIVAVKVLDLQEEGATKSFMAECEALRNIRHRNLVRIITSCSSIDRQGNDFKALVLEFMPNGSLEEWLHPQESDLRTLSLMQLLNIAIDVASALDYLHNHAPKSIIHCDLKPSNVLLDDDMCAHVGDFGLARFLIHEASRSHDYPTSSIEIKGSIGYVAPEYGINGQVSTYGDLYSYGILLLEMFSGRRPTDDSFKDGKGLHEFADMAFPDRILSVVDGSLLYNDDQEANSDIVGKNPIGVAEEKCLLSVMKVGISCSKEVPRERMAIGEAIKELISAKDALLKSNEKPELKA